MSARKRIFAEGWDGACRVYRSLAEGRPLAGVPVPDLLLEHGENSFADTDFAYARFYGLDVSVQYTETATPFTISPARLIRHAMDKAENRRQFRRLAEERDRLAKPEWRDHRQVRAVLTDQRILCAVDGEWLSFWHNGVTQLATDLDAWAFELHYEEGVPLMLMGPDGPAYAVVVAYLLYGVDTLQQPAFAQLATASAAPPPPR